MFWLAIAIICILVAILGVGFITVKILEHIQNPRS